MSNTDKQNHNSNHNHEHTTVKNSKLLLSSLFLTISFMIVEAVVGIYTGSLTILSDAGHMLSDAFALFLSWFALYILKKPADSLRSYGYYRFQVIAAFINGIILLVLSLWIIVEAGIRFTKPIDLEGDTLIYIGITGLIVNMIVFYIVTRGSKDDMNIKSAILHVASDMLGSLAATISGIVIIYTGWMKIDPFLSLFISVLLLRATYRLIKQSGHILMEGTPYNVDVLLLEKEINSTSGVLGLHDLHVWNITSNIAACSFHVVVTEQSIKSGQQILQILADKLKDKFNINHTTIQIEVEGCAKNQIYCEMQKLDHRGDESHH